MENLGTGNEDPGRGKGCRPPGHDGTYSTEINGRTLKFSTPKTTVEAMLNKAGFSPAADHVLIQVLSHSSRSIGLDETVDLQDEGTEVFHAEKSDRVFRFTLNGHGYEWAKHRITEPELRAIGHVHTDEAIVIDRDGCETELRHHDVVDLGERGTEHLFTERRLITVFFENETRELPRGTYTTEQLKERFGVQGGYELEVINEKGQLTPLKPGANLRVKSGMKFFEQVPCGGSS